MPPGGPRTRSARQRPPQRPRPHWSDLNDPYDRCLYALPRSKLEVDGGLDPCCCRTTVASDRESQARTSASTLFRKLGDLSLPLCVCVCVCVCVNSYRERECGVSGFVYAFVRA
jgi:hypothetical protein